MKNYLVSEAIGDIAGSAYVGKGNRMKDYNKVKMFSNRAHFTDDRADAIVYQAMKKLPDWMVEVTERLDEVVNSKL